MTDPIPRDEWEALAAEHALGVLDGADRSRALQLQLSDPTFAAEVDAALAGNSAVGVGTRSGFFASVDGAPASGYRAPRTIPVRPAGAEIAKSSPGIRVKGV